MTEFKPGDGVAYRPHPNAPAEDGEVVRVSADQSLVFVRYSGDFTPKATRVTDLTRSTP